MDVLIELAERCEKAAGPDRSLDLEILTAITGKQWRYSQAWENNTDLVFEERADDAIEIMDPFNEFPEIRMVPKFTASLDAALKLVPNGWGFKADCGLGWGNSFTVGHVGENRLYDWPDSYGRAATPPLALCSAALRARASLPINQQDSNLAKSQL